MHEAATSAEPIPCAPPAASKRTSPLQALGLSTIVTAILLAVEVLAAMRSGSLALLADAGHIATDLLAVGLSWLAAWLALRPPGGQRTFGLHRGGILVAAFNALTLLGMAAFLVHEAYQRLDQPAQVEESIMLAAASLALVINLWLGAKLATHDAGDLNVRSAYLHILGDAMASLGVVVAALLLRWCPQWTWLDPVTAALIGVLIAGSALKILREAARVLMEEAPPELDPEAIARRLSALEGVRSVHDLHVWSITSGLPMLTCHLDVGGVEPNAGQQVLDAARGLLEHEFGVRHATLQLEWERCGSEATFCALASPAATHGHSHAHTHA